MTHKVPVWMYENIDELNDDELDDAREQSVRDKHKRHEARVRRQILTEAREQRRQERLESQSKDYPRPHVWGDEQD